ncbi:hypothetical protein ACRE9R_03140, partial [Klebsiella pneumoniae]
MTITETQKTAQLAADAAVSAAEAKQYMLEAEQGYQDTSAAAQQAQDAAGSALLSKQSAATSEENSLQYATEAGVARDEAVASASTAAEFGDNKLTFADTTAGIAGTNSGQYFRVPQGVGNVLAFRYYKNNSGVAVEVAEYVGQGSISNSVREYSSLTAAQSDISAGNILSGGYCWVRNTVDTTLADEYINNGGTLQPTGRKMPSQGSVDALKEIISEEIAKVMASGAAQTTDAYPDIAELILDSVGHAVYRRYADGTSQFPALMIGSGVELVQIAGGGFVCQLRDTQEEIFKVSASGSIIRGTVTSWITDDESISDYVEIHMDGQGRIYRRVLADGTVEQVGDDGPTDDTSSYPMVASVDGNIIAVQDDTVTQITSDTGVSNISPVAYADFLRYLSNISGNYLTYRSTYDGKFRARESKKKLIHGIITGQSLAAGGSTISQSPVTITAEADFGVISFSTGPKVDFKYDTLDESLLDSVIPARENVGTRPGQESPSSGIAYKIHELTGHTVLVSDACSSGTAIADISSGTATFTGATKMIQAAVAMAEQLGMDYVPVLVLIHGNQNAANGTSIASYRSAMESLRASYENIINTE